MNRKLFTYIAFIGLIGLLSGCEKSGTNVVMLDNPVTPTIKTLPDLTLQRANATDTIVFVGTAVDPGFRASATYFLEACAKGNDFADVTTLYTGVQDTVIKFTVGDLNGLLLKKFTANQVSSIDFRIRSVLVVDAGTGALGTSTNPLVYTSAVTNADVTIYGLPRLDLYAGTTVIGKIESALGDGKYSGFAKLDKTQPFTLKDPDANIVYGVSGGTLVVNGVAFTPADNGWYKLAVDTKALTFTTPDPYFIGLVGDATPNGWNAPDSKMDYDSKSETWNITIALLNATIKFRLNDAWSVNWGGKGSADGASDNYSDATTVPLATGGKNIPLLNGAGTYTVTLDITHLKATVVKK